MLSTDQGKSKTTNYDWKPGHVCSGRDTSGAWKIVRIDEALPGRSYMVTFVEDDLQASLSPDSLRAFTEKEIEHLKKVKPVPGSIDFAKPTEKGELFWECTVTIYDDSRWTGTSEHKAESKRLASMAAFEGGTESGQLMPFAPESLPGFDVTNEGVKVTVTDQPYTCDEWVQRNVISKKCSLLGFDTEWFIAGQGMDLRFQLAIVQLASDTACLIYSTRRSQVLPEKLSRVLKDTMVEKVGVNTVQDELYLQQQYGATCEAVVDLAVLALKLGFGHNVGTRRLAASLLSVFIEKDKTVTVSKWNSWPLSPKQLEYAAADAVVARRLALEMYSKLSNSHQAGSQNGAHSSPSPSTDSGRSSEKSKAAAQQK